LNFGAGLIPLLVWIHQGCSQAPPWIDLFIGVRRVVIVPPGQKIGQHPQGVLAGSRSGHVFADRKKRGALLGHAGFGRDVCCAALVANSTERSFKRVSDCSKLNAIADIAGDSVLARSL
jgi:hypothetical protein